MIQNIKFNDAGSFEALLSIYDTTKMFSQSVLEALGIDFTETGEHRLGLYGSWHVEFGSIQVYDAFLVGLNGETVNINLDSKFCTALIEKFNTDYIHLIDFDLLVEWNPDLD